MGKEMNKAIADKMKEFVEKFVDRQVDKDWWKTDYDYSIDENLGTPENVKHFLQKALEDIYQKGKEDGVRGLTNSNGEIDMMSKNDVKRYLKNGGKDETS